MGALHLSRTDAVFQLKLCNGERDNTFTSAVLAEYEQVFDEIEASRDNASLLITSDHPKTFCNGIDLEWLLAQSADDMRAFLERLENMLIRLALLNLPVVAAINGNAYAGGALLAVSCDFRLMREDRGRFCYSEIRIRKPFTPAMFEVVRLLPDAQASWELTLTGDAWGGDVCAARGVVNAALPLETLQPKALELATDLATRDRNTYTVLKHGLRPGMVALARARNLSA